MKSLKEISRNITPLSEGMFDMEGEDRLEKVVAKDATKMFLDTCKGNFATVYFKDGSCRINGKLILSNLTTDKIYLNIKDFHGKLIIENCSKLDTLEGSFLEKMAVFDGSITINQCPALVSVKGLPSLIKGDLSITNCKKLKSCEGIDTVFGNIYWQGNGKKYTEDQLKEKVHVIKKIFCGEEDVEADVVEGLVSEAFNNQWLQRLAAQLKKYPYKEYSWDDDSKVKYNKVDKIFRDWGRVSSLYGRILDKITSEDIDVYDMSDEKDKKDLAKAFYDAYSDKNANGADVFLVYKEDIGEFIGGFGHTHKARGQQKTGMCWIFFPHKGGSDSNKMGEGVWYSKTEAKQHLLSYGSGYTVVVINSGGNTGTGWKDLDIIERNRAETQRGVINPGDVEQYKEIAAANVKRYKDLAAQIKMNRKKEDTEGYDKIIDEYEKINVRIIKLTRAIAKDPKAYRRYDVEEFFQWIRDEKRYNPNYKPWKKGNSGSQYYGQNGLNYIFKCFMNAYMMCFGDSYKDTPDESDYRSLENATAAMKKVLKIADEKLKSFGA